MELESIVHADNSLLFDPLQTSILLSFLVFSHVSAPAKLCETSDDQVPDLIELWVATDKEHIARDSICQHLLPCDSIITQGQKDPTHIGLNLSIANHSQRVEQVHDTFINQDIDGLL